MPIAKDGSQRAAVFRFPSWCFLLLFIPFAFVVCAAYFKKFPFSLGWTLHIMDQLLQAHFLHSYAVKALGSFVLAGWICWVAYRTGAATLRGLLLPSSLTRLEQGTLGVGLGLGMISMIALLLGTVKLWYPLVFWSLLIMATVLFLSQRPPPCDQGGLITSRISGPWHPLWLGLLIILVGIFLVWDLTPEIFFDSLYYHLAVPNLYKVHHGLVSIPTLLNSNFVMTVQVLYGFALTVGNEITAKLLHGMMGFSLLLAFVAFGQRFLRPGAGVLSALIFLSMPLVGLNIGSTGIDIAWSFFQFLAAYTLIRALTEPKDRWIPVAGIFTGLSASCRYPGLPFIAIACLLIVWVRRWGQRYPWGAIAKDLAQFVLTAALMVTPHLIKNSLWHANPLYPFGGTVWGHPRVDPYYWQIFLTDTHARVLSSDFRDFHSFLRFLLHPWFITMEGYTNADFVGPLYLLLLPLLGLVRHRPLPSRILGRYATCLWMVWLLTSKLPRFGLPALALMTPLLAETILVLGNHSTKWRYGLFSLLVIGVTSNLYANLVLLHGLEGWKVVGGMISEKQYLSQYHAMYPCPPFEGIDWMNSHLPKDAKIVFAGESRSHYTELPVVPSSVPDPQPLVTFARQSSNAAEMAQGMRNQKITHLFLNLAEAIRTEGYGMFPWDKASWTVFKDFWARYVQLIWQKETLEPGKPTALYVYKLLSDDEVAQNRSPPVNPFQRWAPKG